jgi:hypothetical protein
VQVKCTRIVQEDDKRRLIIYEPVKISAYVLYYKHIHASSGIRTHDLSVGAAEDSSCLRPRGHCDRLESNWIKNKKLR